MPPVIALPAGGWGGGGKPLILCLLVTSPGFIALCVSCVDADDQRGSSQRGSESSTQPRRSQAWVLVVARSLEEREMTRACVEFLPVGHCPVCPVWP